MNSSASGLALRAVGLGVLSGMRSMTGPATFSYIASRHPENLESTPFARAATPEGLIVVGLMALGEIGVDKLPFVPARVAQPQLAVRVGLGALAGAGLFAGAKQPSIIGAILGGAGSFISAHIFYRLRGGIGKRLGIPDFFVALAEDALLIACARALAGKDADE
jgi:uncharacterized membrane protein